MMTHEGRIGGLFPFERRYYVHLGGLRIRLLCQEQSQNDVCGTVGPLTGRQLLRSWFTGWP